MHDLEFEPAIPIFTGELGDEEGYFAALNLSYLGTNAVPALVDALQSTNSAIRVRAASMANRVGDERFYRALFERWNDPESEVRLKAAGAAVYCPAGGQVEPLLQLVQDGDEDVRKAVVPVLSNALNVDKQEQERVIAVVREMLKKGDPGLATTALELFSGLVPRPAIPDDDLRELLKVPDWELFNAVYEWLWRTRFECSCDDAEPLLKNPLMAARVLGLQVLQGAGTRRAVDLAIPLLHDREQRVREQAEEVLRELSQNEQPENWDRWWAMHKADLPRDTEAHLVSYFELIGRQALHFPVLFSYPIFPAYDGERWFGIAKKSGAERTPIEERDFEFYRAYRRAARFLHQTAVPKSFRYLGAGVTLGDKERMVFAFLPKGATNFRVIFGDLTMKDVPAEDLPPLTPSERRLRGDDAPRE